MATAIAFEDAKARQFRVEGDGIDVKGGAITTPFFGAPGDRNNRDVPQAFMSQVDAGRVSRAHFHAIDQFQVVVRGGVKVGRHDMTSCGVHFARAFTPYGPLVMNADTGMTQLVLRPFHDPKGPLRIPDNNGMLQSMPERRPWQVFTRHVAFPALDAGTVAADMKLEAVPGMKNEEGLATYTFSMKPNGKATAPDPSHGHGQFVVVVKGSLIHDKKEHKAIALVHVKADEGPYQIHSGPAGLEGLVLNFPQSQTLVAPAPMGARAGAGNAWQCTMCAFLYDQSAGLAEEAILPGTEWQKLPETWSCPNCSSSKSLFKQV